jgi:hypothetical protein
MVSFPFIPFEKPPSFSFACVSQNEGSKQFTRTGFPFLLLHALKRGTKAKVIEARQFGIEVALVRHNANQVLRCLWIACAVNASNPDRVLVIFTPDQQETPRL